MRRLLLGCCVGWEAGPQACCVAGAEETAGDSTSRRFVASFSYRPQQQRRQGRREEQGGTRGPLSCV